MESQTELSEFDLSGMPNTDGSRISCQSVETTGGLSEFLNGNEKIGSIHRTDRNRDDVFRYCAN